MTSASSDIVDVAGTSGAWILANTLNGFNAGRCVAPTGTANGVFVNYTYSAQVDSVNSGDSIYPFHIHATGAGGTGYFANDQSYFSALETTGNVAGWFIDSVDGTFSPSLRIRHSSAGSPAGVVGATTTGMLVKGSNLNDLMVDGFETAQQTIGINVNNVSSSSGDIHFVNTINDGFGQSGFLIQNLPQSSGNIEISGGWMAPHGGATGADFDCENSGGITMSHVTIYSNYGGGDPYAGIYLNGCYNNTFTGNNLQNTNSYGFLLNGSIQNSITGNLVVGSSGASYGIKLTNTSTNNTINGNVFSGLGSTAACMSFDATSTYNQGIESNHCASYATTLSDASVNGNSLQIAERLNLSPQGIYYSQFGQLALTFDTSNAYVGTPGNGWVEDVTNGLLTDHMARSYWEFTGTGGNFGYQIIPPGTTFFTGNAGVGGIALSDAPTFTTNVNISGVNYPTATLVVTQGGVGNIVITSAGTGGTPGTVSINGVGGSCGQTPVIQTVTSSGGVITNASITTPGYGCSSTPTFTPASGTGVLTATLNTTTGTVPSGTVYAKIVTIDSQGYHSLPGNEVSAVVHTSSNSIIWHWTQTPGAASYQVWVGTSSGGENYYFAAPAVTSFTQTLPVTGGTSGTIPATATTLGSLLINGVAVSAGTYTLPTATSSVLGGVKPDGISILNSSGVISATATSVGADPSGAAAGLLTSAETISGAWSFTNATTNFGVPGTTTGILKLGSSGSGGSVSVTPATATSAFTATLPANTGTIAELNLAQTWTALQTFGTNISVGGVTPTGATGTGNFVLSAAPSLTGLVINNYNNPGGTSAGGLVQTNASVGASGNAGASMSFGIYDAGSSTSFGGLSVTAVRDGSYNDLGVCLYGLHGGASAYTFMCGIASTGGIQMPQLHSTTGTRYLCVDSSGNLSASAAVCTGT
jgi:parallel beta-helix repeat protein